MLNHAAHIVRPLLAVVRQDRLIERKLIGFVIVIGGNDAHAAVVTLCAADHRLVIDSARQHETVVIVGVLANKVNAARCLNVSGRRVAEFFGKQGMCLFFQAHCYSPDSRKWTSLTARRRSAACSAVKSRWVSASISYPTINLRTVALRSSGG